MDPHKFLKDAQAMTPAELVKFARLHSAGFDSIETFALMLALTAKLESMIDDQTASIRFDFRRVADRLEDVEMAADQAMINRACPLDPDNSSALDRRTRIIAPRLTAG